MFDFSSEKYIICPVGHVKSQYLYTEDALGKGGLTDRFCLEKGSMDVMEGEQRLLLWTGPFCHEKTSISEHTRLSRILVFPHCPLVKGLHRDDPPFLILLGLY